MAGNFWGLTTAELELLHVPGSFTKNQDHSLAATTRHHHHHHHCLLALKLASSLFLFRAASKQLPPHSFSDPKQWRL
jgi:hypothetical protein